MIFEIETMEPTQNKIGGIYTVIHWSAGKPIQRTGRVIAHKPAINIASFHRVVFDDLK